MREKYDLLICKEIFLWNIGSDPLECTVSVTTEKISVFISSNVKI
jgi:hypothetical protein